MIYFNFLLIVPVDMRCSVIAYGLDRKKEDAGVAMDANVWWRCEQRGCECLLGQWEALTQSCTTKLAPSLSACFHGSLSVYEFHTAADCSHVTAASVFFSLT